MDTVNADATYTLQGVKYVAATSYPALAQLPGGVYASMGAEAYEVFGEGNLSMPVETGEGVIALAVVEKVAKIFHGANLMADYVQKYYTN